MWPAILEKKESIFPTQVKTAISGTRVGLKLTIGNCALD